MGDVIHVAVRVRKLIDREKDNKEIVKWKVQGNNILRQIDINGLPVGDVSYVFDRVFNPNETNFHVYEELCKPIVNSVMEGFNGTIFAYGQTSSGKTYTMRGDEKESGVVIHTIAEIFEAIENTPHREFLLRVSYMEIYNEQLLDLLTKNPSTLKIKENSDGQVSVANLTEEMVKSANEVIAVMQRGEAKRRCGETSMNEKSSRSHSIFRMIIESRPVGAGPNEAVVVRVSHLNLVDLAGSERTGQMGTTGDRFKEGVNINRSLLMLGHVISKLSEGEGSFVNYRDSKLTRILQNSLGGNAKTAIICTVTPVFFEQTRSTLNFASRAKQIKNKPIVNEIVSDAALLNLRQKQIRNLELQLQEMKKCDKQLEVEAMAKQLEEKELMINALQGQIEKMKTQVLVSSRVQDEPLTRRNRRETWCAPVRRKNKSILGMAIPFMSTLHEGDENRARLSSPFDGTTPKENDSSSADVSFHTKDFRDSLEFLAEMDRINENVSQDNNFSQIDARKQQDQAQILTFEQKIEELENQLCSKKQQEEACILNLEQKLALEQKVEELENQLQVCVEENGLLKVELKELKIFTTDEKQVFGEQPLSILDRLRDLKKTNDDTQLLLHNSNKRICELQTENKRFQEEIEQERERLRDEKVQLIHKNKQILLDYESRGKKLVEMEDKLTHVEQDQKDFVAHLESKWKSRESELCKQLEKAYTDLPKWENGDPLASQRISEFESNLRMVKEDLETSEKFTAELQETILLNCTKVAELQKENDSLKEIISGMSAKQDISKVEIFSTNKAVEEITSLSTQTSFTQNPDPASEIEIKEMKYVARIVEELLLQFKNVSRAHAFEDASVIGEDKLESRDASCETSAQPVMASVTRVSSILQGQSRELGNLRENITLLQNVVLSAKEELSKLAKEKEQLATSLTCAEFSNKKLENQLVFVMKRESELLGSLAELEMAAKSKASLRRDNFTQMDESMAVPELKTASDYTRDDISQSNVNPNYLETEIISLKCQIAKYESDIVDLQNQLTCEKLQCSNILKDRSSKECCISQLQDGNNILTAKYNQLSEELRSAAKTLSEATSQKDALQRKLFEANLAKDDLAQELSAMKAELSDLKEKYEFASGEMQSLVEEKGSIQKRCIELEKERQIKDESCQETSRQLQLERQSLVKKQEQLLKQLNSERKNALHALLENDEMKKQVIETRLAKDDLTRRCSQLSSEARNLKERLKECEEKVGLLGYTNEELRQKCSGLEVNGELAEINKNLSEVLQAEKMARSCAVAESETLQRQLVEAKLEKEKLFSKSQKLEHLKNAEESCTLVEEKNILDHRCSTLEKDMKCKLKEIERLQQEVILKERNVQELRKRSDCILEKSEQMKLELLDKVESLKILQNASDSKTKLVEMQSEQLMAKENEIQEKNSKLESESFLVIRLNLDLTEKLQENARLEEVIKSMALETETLRESMLEKENELAILGKQLETSLFNFEKSKEETIFKARTIQELQTKEQDKQKLLATLEERMNVKESRLEEMKKKMAATSNELRDFKKDIQAKVVKIDILNKDIQHCQTTAKVMKQTLFDKENIILSLNKKLEKSSEQIQQLQEAESTSSVTRKHQPVFDFKKLKEETVFKDHTIKELQIEIQGKKELLSTLEERMNAKEIEVEETKKRLDKALKELRDVKEDINVKVAEIDVLHKDIQHQERTAKGVKQTLYKKENIILDLKRNFATSSEQLQKLQEEVKNLKLPASEQILRLKEENEKLQSRIKDEKQLQEELKEDIFNFQTELQGSKLWEIEAECLQKELDELKAKETARLSAAEPEVQTLRQRYAELQAESALVNKDAKLFCQKYDTLKEYYKDLLDEKRVIESTVAELEDYARRPRANVKIQTEGHSPREEDIASLRNEVLTLQQMLMEKERSLTVQGKELESQFSKRLQQQAQQIEELQQKNTLLKDVTKGKGVPAAEEIPKSQSVQLEENPRCDEKTIESLKNEVVALQKRLRDRDSEIARTQESNRLLKKEIRRRENSKTDSDTAEKDSSTKENWDLIEYGGSGFINRLQVCQINGELKQLQKEYKKLKAKYLKLKESQENIPVNVKTPPTVPRSKSLGLGAEHASNVSERSSTRLLTSVTNNQMTVATEPTPQDDVTLTIPARHRLEVFRTPPKQDKEDDCKMQ